MADDFLSKFLGSANRARVVRVFILNRSEMFTAAQAGKRAGIKPPAALREIKLLLHTGILKKVKSPAESGGAKRTPAGKQKDPAWTFDPAFEYALSLSKFIHEVSPVQHKAILDTLKRTGRLSAVILSGAFMGDPTRPADLLVAADGLSESRLEAAIKSFEPAVGHEIRYAIFSTPEFRYRLTVQDRLMRDTLDYPHIILLDRGRLL